MAGCVSLVPVEPRAPTAGIAMSAPSAVVAARIARVVFMGVSCAFADTGNTLASLADPFLKR
jgi:hypothetical protein